MNKFFLYKLRALTRLKQYTPYEFSLLIGISEDFQTSLSIGEVMDALASIGIESVIQSEIGVSDMERLRILVAQNALFDIDFNVADSSVVAPILQDYIEVEPTLTPNNSIRLQSNFHSQIAVNNGFDIDHLAYIILDLEVQEQVSPTVFASESRQVLSNVENLQSVEIEVSTPQIRRVGFSISDTVSYISTLTQLEGLGISGNSHSTNFVRSKVSGKTGVHILQYNFNYLNVSGLATLKGAATLSDYADNTLLQLSERTLESMRIAL